MNITRFREVIQERERIEEMSCGEWEEGIEVCRKKIIEILSEDISSTIAFLKSECLPEEYSWVCEVLEDIVELQPSQELVECCKTLMERFTEQCELYDIKGYIEGAEAIVKWGGTSGEETE